MDRPHLELILARSLVAHVAVAAFLADPDGRVVYFNEAAESLIGRSFEETPEINGKDVIALLEPRTIDGEPVKPDALPIPLALATRLPATLHAMVGFEPERAYLATALPLFDRGGKVIGALSMWYPEDV